MGPMDFAALPMSRKKTSILFVCLANICRSPALMATLKHLAIQRRLGDQINVDSCGLGWYHLGEHPDRRVFETAKKRGITIDHRAHQFEEKFFDEFDYIFAVDSEVVEQLKVQAKTEAHKKKIHLATAFSKKHKNQPISDPYYLSSGFEEIMDLIFDSCEGILNHIA